MDLHGIDNLGIDRVLTRGNEEIISNQNNALHLKDNE